MAVRFRGPIRLRTALISDRLNPLEDLLNQLDARNTWRLVQPLGLNNLENASSPEKLLEGGGSVSLLEIAQGMSVFANLGDLFGVQTFRGGDTAIHTAVFGRQLRETLIQQRSHPPAVGTQRSPGIPGTSCTGG